MNPQLQIMLQQGIQAFQNGNFDGADSILRRIIQVDSKNLPALHVLGLIKASQEKYAEAAQLLGRAARMSPNDPSIQYNLAKALMDSGFDKESIPHHKKSVELAPNNPDAWLNYGKTQAALHFYAEALIAFDKALALAPNYAEAYLNKGATLKELHRHEEALIFAERALALNPNLADAWVNKGVALKELTRYEDAIAQFEKALSLVPEYAEAWYNKGNALQELKRYEDALVCFDKCISLKPEYTEARYNKGNALQELKRYEEAITCFDKSISLKHDYAEAWSNKGVALNELERYEEAITCFDKSISLKHDYAEAWSNKGVALNELERYEEAITCFDKSISLKHDYAEAWSNKGISLNKSNSSHEQAIYEEAICYIDKALGIKPDYAEGWCNKGNTLHALKRYEEAISHYDRATNLKPNYPECWMNKGVSLNQLKRYEEAIAHYDRAINLKPDYPECLSNKGIALNELKHYEDAIAHYEEALSLKSEIDWVHGELLHTKMKICSWLGFDAALENVTHQVGECKKTATPFSTLALIDNPGFHKQCTEIYAQFEHPFNSVLGPIQKYPKRPKIRIGYFSADFRSHAVSYLTAELFELHDKNNFEIFAFSFSKPEEDLMRLRLMKSFDRFIDVSDMSDKNIAELSRELGVDIAIDLGGFTAGSRTGIFAYRAAPIQAGYIGYLGSLGLEYIDYLLADKTIIPDGSEHFYSEKIAYLPSYQVNDRKRLIPERQFARQELGLPDNGFVFCCFNNNYKILPATFDGWMRILKAVDDSVLFLYADNQWSESNLKKEAENRGVDAKRLVFGRRIPAEEYLARYRVCDLFLDTAPYNAGTTASDALWVGLPVLTLMGQSFASRVAASLLNAIHLPELITSTQSEYESLAIDLATHPRKLAAVKQKLANNRLTTPLFNTPLFTKNLEAVYLKMYERYQTDLGSDHISIA